MPSNFTDKCPNISGKLVHCIYVGVQSHVNYKAGSLGSNFCKRIVHVDFSCLP
jgi:hypothetical protein